MDWHRRPRVDARGNTGEIGTQFDIEHERLAFPIDPAKGDLFMCEMVFADPVPQVVDMLTHCDDREAMWWHFPAMVDDELLCDEDRALNQSLRGVQPLRSVGRGR